MLMPKRVKYRKQQRGRMRGKAYRGSTVAFGEYGLQALEPAWITNRQIEAARVAITRSIKRGGKMWIRIFPDKPVTKKPAETRMGKGKGAPEFWVASIRPGRIMFELEGITKEAAKAAMRLAPRSFRSGCVSSSASSWEGTEMAGKRFRELENLTPTELEQRLGELRDQLFQNRFKNSMRQLDDPLKIRSARRDIARVLTLLRRNDAKGGTA